jgi:molybdopterin-guanine dinucleotide biosynthesis protein A
MSNETIGILLAGGRATRMGGGDKSLRTIGGKTILDHVIATMRPQCAALVLNANGDVARLAAYGLPIVADDVPNFAGPLAGILAGLDFIAAYYPKAAFAVSVATDTPFLPHDLVAHLHVARQAADATLACARSGRSTHPVIGLWPIGIRADLRHALVGEDIRKIDRFTQRHSIAYADWQMEPYDPFFNANVPDDLEAAERIWLQRE